MEIRALTTADAAPLAALLEARAPSATFLRSALTEADDALGATADGAGVWAGALRDGALVSVALHRAMGIAVVDGEAEGASAAAELAVGLSRRPLAGLLGEFDATQAALDRLGVGAEALRFDSHEALYELALEGLVLPAAMTDGRRGWRPPRDAELDLLQAWRAEYEAELAKYPVTEGLRLAARAKVERFQAEGRHWVAVEDDRPVAVATWNAAIADRVQIGGVFTPPALRGRGCGRSAVAGALLAARESGRTWGSLFTADDNAPARRAYEALGFVQVGWYGIRLLAEPLPVFGA